MTGIFPSAAAQYARHNIPTIPLRLDGERKGPLVKNFKISQLTVGHSQAFARRHADADAIGIPDGPLSGIVRLDIDQPGDAIVFEVIRRAGDTPAKVRTASGKTHLLYADNGERRLTGKPGSRNARPWDDLKVDLCGQGGYSIAPPSRRADGATYDLLGDVPLDDVLQNRHRLPKIRGLDARAYVIGGEETQPAAPANDEPAHKFSGYEDLGQVPVGSRDAAIYPIVARAAKRIFENGGTVEELMAEARNRNAEFPEPLPAEEVFAKCNLWWKQTKAGKNKFGPGCGAGKVKRVVNIDEEAFNAVTPLGADACMMYMILRHHHWGASFAVANDMRFKMPDGLWTEPRFVKARRALLDADIIKPFAPSNFRANRAALYSWNAISPKKTG